MKIARTKGSYLAPLLDLLTAIDPDNVRLTFLCHSMGNRIFQHMLMGSNLSTTRRKRINHYISVGADLESNIFEKGEPLEWLHTVVDDITIYIHDNDRSLTMSKLVNKSLRVGLNGVDLQQLPENFKIVDVSNITDHINFVSSISNHRYFYMSPAVMKDLGRMVRNEDINIDKRILDHPRKYQLLR